MKYYKKKYKLAKKDFPVSSDYAATNISLPIYPQLKKHQIEKFAEQLTILLHEKNCINWWMRVYWPQLALKLTSLNYSVFIIDSLSVNNLYSLKDIGTNTNLYKSILNNRIDIIKEKILNIFKMQEIIMLFQEYYHL